MAKVQIDQNPSIYWGLTVSACLVGLGGTVQCVHGLRASHRVSWCVSERLRAVLFATVRLPENPRPRRVTRASQRRGSYLLVGADGKLTHPAD